MAPNRYKSLVDALASDIRSGVLVPGTRLPPHRTFARQHHLALVTASRVYAELEAMGLVSGEPGRGTFVRETTLPPGHGVDQPAVAPGMADLNFNYPELPGQANLLRTALRRLASSGDLESLLRYQPLGGRPHERAAVAQHLHARGLQVTAPDVLLVNGAQHGLAVSLMALLNPGDVIAADALTYPGFKVVAESLHLELVAIPVTANGPDMDALEQLCRKRRVRAVYTMPTLHNPMGWVLNDSQRHRTVEIARKHNLILIEDAVYAFLAENPPAPLTTRAPERTVYISSISKSMATGLRTGFVVAPPTHIAAIERAIRATAWHTAGLLTAITTTWIEDGTVTALEKAKRDDAQSRQKLARKYLRGMPYISHPSSYFIWLPLPEDARADHITTTLLHEGISVSTAEPYCTSNHVPHAIRLALGSVDMDTLEQSLRVIQKLLRAYV